MINEKAYKFSTRDSTEFVIDNSNTVELANVTIVNDTDAVKTFSSIAKIVDYRTMDDYQGLIEEGDPNPFYGLNSGSVTVLAGQTKTVQIPANKEHPFIFWTSSQIEETENVRFYWKSTSNEGYIMILGDCELRIQ